MQDFNRFQRRRRRRKRRRKKKKKKKLKREKEGANVSEEDLVKNMNF
jgi:hypothetical protein